MFNSLVRIRFAFAARSDFVTATLTQTALATVRHAHCVVGRDVELAVVDAAFLPAAFTAGILCRALFTDHKDSWELVLPA